MKEQIATLIDELSDKSDFEPPMPTDELAKAAKLGALPDELRAFYERAGGGTVGPVDIFTSDELLDVNKRRPKVLAKAAFFASDGADGFFFIDAGNALKKGTSAVYWHERGTTGLKGAVFAAPDLVAFLRAVAAGATPWVSSSLGTVAVDAMVQKLKAMPDRWTGQPGSWPAVDEASTRVGVYIGEELEQLLLTADGFTIPGVGVTVRDTKTLEPVPEIAKETGRPAAIWFASDTKGNQYAVTTVGWQGTDGGDVVRLRPGEDLASAPVLGSLPAVIVAWLEGKQP